MLSPSAVAAALLLLAVARAANAATCPHGGDLVTALLSTGSPCRAAVRRSTPSARRAVCPLSARAASSRAPPRATPTTWSPGASSRTSTPGGSTLGDRVDATGYMRQAGTNWELGEAIAWAQQPLDTAASLDARVAGQPRPPRDHARPPFREVGIGVAAGLTDGSGHPGATAVLDFGFRDGRLRCRDGARRQSCARTARRSRQGPLGAHRPRRARRLSTPASRRSSIRSATTWRAQRRRRRLPPRPRRDQLRLGLVSDPAQAHGVARATSPWPGRWPTAGAPVPAGPTRSCARCAPTRSPTRSARRATTS